MKFDIMLVSYPYTYLVAQMSALAQTTLTHHHQYVHTMPGQSQRVKSYLEEQAETAAAASADAPSCGSYLFAILVRLWSWGFLSPQTVQKVAHAVLKDLNAIEVNGVRIKSDIDKLASIGNYGKYEGNCNRDLKERLGTTPLTLHNCTMPLKLLGGTLGATAYVFEQGMLLPHLLIAAMGQFYKKSFEKLICPGADRIQQFWKNMKGNPQLEGNTSSTVT